MDRRYRKRMDAYWFRQERKALRDLEIRDIEKGWFDLWHTHPDWRSKGNRFPKNRKAVAAITYRLLLRAEELAATRKEPIQVFAILCEDTGSNAVYLHTPNPNGTPFPCELEATDWGLKELPNLGSLVDTNTHEIGKSQHEDGTDYIIRKRA